MIIEKGHPIARTENNSYKTPILASNQSKTSAQLPIAEVKKETKSTKPKKNTSVFGTSTGENTNIKIYSSDLEAYSNSLKGAKIILLETIGVQKLVNQGYLKLKNSEEINTSSATIPKNSVFTGQVFFKDGAAYVKTVYVEVNGDKLPVKLSADISGGNNLINGSSLEDGYDIYFKL